MAEYLYRCENGHKTWLSHGMLEVITTYCPECGEPMRKVPLPVAINWGGFRYEASPAVKQHLAEHEERKAEGLL